MFKFGRENKTANGADLIDFGGERIAIPKLTVEKWRQLADNIHALPQIVLDVLMNRGTDNFTATVLAAIDVAMDEIIDLVSVLTEKDSEWIEKNVGVNELLDFILKTIQKNDLAEAGKKFRAVFGNLMTPGAAKNPSPSTNGLSTAPSDSA